MVQGEESVHPHIHGLFPFTLQVKSSPWVICCQPLFHNTHELELYQRNKWVCKDYKCRGFPACLGMALPHLIPSESEEKAYTDLGYLFRIDLISRILSQNRGKC